MEFRFLSFIHVNSFWNGEALSIRNILENVIQNILTDVLLYAFHTLSMKLVHICIIFNALSHVTINFLRKHFSMEL